MTKHISRDWKCKFNSTTCKSDQKLNYATCQCECRNYWKCIKHYSWNLSTCMYENSKYLEGIAETSVITCDGNISAMDVVSPKITNTIAINMSINSNDKKVKYCYILQTVLSVIICW